MLAYDNQPAELPMGIADANYEQLAKVANHSSWRGAALLKEERERTSWCDCAAARPLMPPRPEGFASLRRIRFSDGQHFGAPPMPPLPQVSLRASPWLVYPPRIISERDAHQLHVIAIGAMLTSPRLASALLEELGRAVIRPDAEAPPGNIGLGSTAVCFESDGPRSRYHHAQIVAPEDAAPGFGRVSVLTDLGAALIGLAQHQSILWRDGRGGVRQFAVLEVETPALQAEIVRNQRNGGEG